MSLRLRALELHIPAWLARRAVRRLFDATTAAFALDRVDVRDLGHREVLESYARFTVAAADEALADGGDRDALADRLWKNAEELGRSLRRLLGVRTREEALRAVRIAYRMIEVDLWPDACGNVVVARCAFARWYSPAVCRLMSFLDAGLIAGLTEGGRLTFSERITEGRPRCLARISWRGTSS